MVNALVLGLPGSGRTSVVAALRAAGVDAREADADDLTPTGDGAAAEHLPCVVVTASALDGISGELADMWEAVAERYQPRVLLWTFSDIGRADDDDMRAIAERVLGEPSTAVALPLADDDEEFAGVLDLRDWTITDAAGQRPADAEHREAAASLRDELIDAVLTVVDDEAALGQRMSGMEPGPARLRALVGQALRSGQFVPSMSIRATDPAIGIDVLADILRSAD